MAAPAVPMHQNLAELSQAKGRLEIATSAKQYTIPNIDRIQALAIEAMKTPIPADEGAARDMALLFQRTGGEVVEQLFAYKEGAAKAQEKQTGDTAVQAEKRKYDALTQRSVASIACERTMSFCGSALKTVGKVALYAAPVVLAAGVAYYYSSPETIGAATTFLTNLKKNWW